MASALDIKLFDANQRRVCDYQFLEFNFISEAIKRNFYLNPCLLL